MEITLSDFEARCTELALRDISIKDVAQIINSEREGAVDEGLVKMTLRRVAFRIEKVKKDENTQSI